MKPLDIKIALMRAGVTQAEVGRKLNISRAFVNQVIGGQRATKRVRKAIARVVKKRIRDLWPPESSSRKAA